jgi:hypothetical protein
MSKLRVSQVRSGEGSILTRFSNIGPEVLPDVLPEACDGVLLVASDAFETSTPAGGEQVEAHLYAFRGEPARAMLRDPGRWASRVANFALLPAFPDEDARRRCIPQALRPWDPERMKATVYGQLGTAYAHRGLWFARDVDRRRFVEAAVSPFLAAAGHRLPNGDVTIVLEMPTDSTFEATYSAKGTGPAFTVRRRFDAAGLVREWRIDRGEWRATERRTATRAGTGWRARLVDWAASAGIFLLSLPTFLLALAVVLIARGTGTTTTLGRDARPRQAS